MTETIHRNELHDVSFQFTVARILDVLAIMQDVMRQHPERDYTKLAISRDYPQWNLTARWTERVSMPAPTVQPQECQGCGELTTNFSCWCDACRDADI